MLFVYCDRQTSSVTDSKPKKRKGLKPQSRKRRLGQDSNYDEGAALAVALVNSLQEAQAKAEKGSPRRKSARQEKHVEQQKAASKAKAETQRRAEAASKLRESRSAPARFSMFAIGHVVIVSDSSRRGDKRPYHSSRGSKTAYMLMYQKVSSMKSVPALTGLLPNEVAETLRQENGRRKAEALSYFTSEHELLDACSARQAVYQKQVKKLFAPPRQAAADTVTNGVDPHDSSRSSAGTHRWIASRVLADWVSGRDILHRFVQHKTPAENASAGGEVINLVDGATDTHVVQGNGVANINTLQCQLSDVSSGLQLCEHGRIPPRTASTHFKRIPEQAWQLIFDADNNDFPSEYLDGLAASEPSDFECRICGDSWEVIAKRKKEQAQNFRRLFAWLDVLTCRGKRNWNAVDADSPLYASVTVNPDTGMFNCCWLSKTYVAALI